MSIPVDDLVAILERARHQWEVKPRPSIEFQYSLPLRFMRPDERPTDAQLVAHRIRVCFSDEGEIVRVDL